MAVVSRSVPGWVLLAVFLGGCLEKPNMSTREFYARTLNFASFPAAISSFSGEGTEVFPAFATEGYFRYRAPRSYLDMLLSDRDFLQRSDFNEQIHLTPCRGPQMPSDFKYWTQNQISLEGKECFTGIFVPYVHYLVYDPSTNEVEHFVTGMRE